MGIHLLFVNMLANRMSVNVPSRLGGPAILKGLVVYQLVGMFSCYFIAVGLGHVKPLPHVPMISDLCVSFPEAYVFRAVFVMVASAMMVASVTFHDYIQLQLDLAGIPGDRAVHMTNRAACGVSALSCVFLIVLTVCSENEDDRVHSVSAVIFFVLYLVYMGLVTRSCLPLWTPTRRLLRWSPRPRCGSSR